MGRDIGDSARPLTARERDTILSAIGASVAKARAAAGLTLAATADGAGLSKDYLWRLEKGRQTASFLTLASIAAACGTTVYALVAAAEREEATSVAERGGPGA